jgi:hypothetical protein
MKKVVVRVAALLVFLIALGFTPFVALGDTFNIVPYYATGSDGDWWKYQYTKLPVAPTNPDFSPEFTVAKTLITLGKFTWGPWILPDKTDTYTYSADTTNLYFYDSIGNLAATVDGLVKLDTFIASPFPGNTGMQAYYTRLPSADVMAGTFADILVEIILDMAYPENEANRILNQALGMPLGAGGGVTHISGLARTIGEIINIDFDAADPDGRILWSYELAEFNVHTPSAPLPGTLLLLGSGLVGLMGLRRRLG